MSTSANAIPVQSFRAKISRKGVITIPLELRISEGMNPGDYVCFELPQEDGSLPIRSVRMSICKNSSRVVNDSPMQSNNPDAILPELK
jgi:bifunctional DNA-binding transcriptional regulator/antitoxin component of YhaV-PrlF toxin-antitoxin module